MKDEFSIIETKLPSDINIYPIADVHFGSILHNERAWNDFCKTVMKEENNYFILNGDLINNNTRSSVGSSFEDNIRPRDQKRMMCDMLYPIKDRILCMVSGNHENRSMKDADDDPTYDIACKLDIEDVYRQDAAFLRLYVGERKHGKRNPHVLATYNFAVTHGSGGGMYTGASVNRNERFGSYIDGIDCLVVGHSHKPVLSRPGKLKMDSQSAQVKVESFLVISCVSWQNYGGYALRKMLQPSEICNPQIIQLETNTCRKYIRTIW